MNAATWNEFKARVERLEARVAELEAKRPAGAQEPKVAARRRSR